jgi:hypothetical protein
MNYLVFNSKNLDNNVDYEALSLEIKMPEKKVNRYSLARTDGEKVTGSTYGSSRIIAKGRIKSDSRAAMDIKLDRLKSYLSPINKDLDVYVSGAVRRYVATVESFESKVEGYSCFFTITFVSNGLAKDTVTTALTVNSPITTSSTTHTADFGGTYNARPLVDFTIVGCDPYWESKYIEFSNAHLLKKIRFTRTWVWGDRVVFDGDTKTVLLYPSTSNIIDACESITGWTSTHTLSLEASLMKQGSGCLKQVMAGAASVVSASRLNATAVDLNSTVGKVIIPIFIPTPTAGAVASVGLVLGSDATLASNYVYWTKTTQYDGSALATNAWNFIEVDLSTSPTGSAGTAVRTAIKSIRIDVTGTSGAMQLNGVLIDYLTYYKASIVGQALDYEGIFPEFEPGSGTLTIADELTSRRITLSGTYYKRYL